MPKQWSGAGLTSNVWGRKAEQERRTFLAPASGHVIATSDVRIARGTAGSHSDTDTREYPQDGIISRSRTETENCILDHVKRDDLIAGGETGPGLCSLSAAQGEVW